MAAPLFFCFFFSYGTNMILALPSKNTSVSMALMVGGILLIDLLTKAWAQNALAQGPLEITTWFKLTYSENPGIALGIPLGGWPVLVLTVFLLGGFLAYAFRTLDLSRFSIRMAVSLILAGALGNFYDRLVYGIVRDFLHFGNWHIFNVADVAITVGVFLLLLILNRPSHERHGSRP